jgi:hypothetical protein
MNRITNGLTRTAMALALVLIAAPVTASETASPAAQN